MKEKRILIIILSVIAIAAIVLISILIIKPTSNVIDADMASGEDPSLQYFGEDNQLVLINENPVDVLNQFMKWSQYPPDSRPLFEGQVDLIEPYTIKNLPTPAFKVLPNNCKPDDEECGSQIEFLEGITCDFNSEIQVSFGTDPIHFLLFCSNENNERLKLESLVAQVFRTDDGKATPSLPVISASDDGANGDVKANDRIYTITVKPGKQDWGFMTVSANFKINGNQITQVATWYSTPHTVAEFQDGVTDSIQDGHLVVRVPLLVKKAGYFLIESNLQEKNNPNRFIATATYEGKLNVGRQIIPLRFWGKLLGDQGIDGPYLVREIRARRDNAVVTPDMVERSFQTGEELHGEQIEPLWEYVKIAPIYETNEYRAKDFSKELWDSDQKQQRIKFLKQLIEEEG